jgi:hypothetical protein
MKTTIALWEFRPSAFTGLARLLAHLVCWWMGSEWAHVGVSLDGLYIEADPFKGVVSGPVPENALCVKVWTVRDTPATKRWIHRQLGKPYDWPGILGFVIGRSEAGRRQRGRWFCSELATVILRKSGVEVCGDTPAWEIDPGEMATGTQPGQRPLLPRGRPRILTLKKRTMKNKIHYLFQAGLTCLALGLSACGTTGPDATTTMGTAAATPSTGATASAMIEAALPLVRTGASVATGAVLDFAVNQTSTRARLANEMYAAANAVYSAFGGSQTDAGYAQFSTAIAGLYAAYYPKLITGDTKTATDLLNAIAGGIEDATQAYVTTPVAPVSVALTTVSF